MARERQSTILDGHRYEMSVLTATTGYRLFLKLLKTFGPSFGALMDAMPKSGDIQDVDLSSEVVVRGISVLTNNVKESDLDHVIDTLKKVCHVGIGGSDKTVALSSVFDAHFAGSVPQLFKWVWWGLTVQFRDFSNALASSKPPSEGANTPAASNQTQ